MLPSPVSRLPSPVFPPLVSLTEHGASPFCVFVPFVANPVFPLPSPVSPLPAFPLSQFRFRRLDGGQQAVDDVFGGDAIRFGSEIRQNAMAQHIRGHGANIAE